MLYPGDRLVLSRETLAIVLVCGKRRAKYLPVGALIKVLPTYLPDDKSVEVDWEGQIATMFAVDLEERGEQIEAAVTMAAKSAPSA